MEKPIIFNSEMVRATLKNLKTQTRRVILQNNHKPPTGKFVHFLDSLGYPASEGKLWAGFGNPEDPVYVKCPYGIVGDRLYVRETFACGTHMGQLMTTPKELGEDMWVAWKENYNDDAPALKQLTWKPSIHMPKWAARIWLEITKIRVERVQDISHNDWVADFAPTFREQEKALETFVGNTNKKEMAKTLWDSINAKRSFGWDKNPWVWVIEFKKQ